MGDITVFASGLTFVLFCAILMVVYLAQNLDRLEAEKVDLAQRLHQMTEAMTMHSETATKERALGSKLQASYNQLLTDQKSLKVENKRLKEQQDDSGDKYNALLDQVSLTLDIIKHDYPRYERFNA